MQFFAAGFETSASTVAYTLYEIALNIDIQEKLRDEILTSIEASHEVTYQIVKEMKYLNMCVMGKLSLS